MGIGLRPWWRCGTWLSQTGWALPWVHLEANGISSRGLFPIQISELCCSCVLSKYLADLLHSRPHSWEWRITGLPPILYEGCWLDSQSHWGFGRLELDSSSLSYITSPSFHLVHIISISVWCVKVECRSKITSTYLDRVYLCFELALLRWAYFWVGGDRSLDQVDDKFNYQIEPLSNF